MKDKGGLSLEGLGHYLPLPSDLIRSAAFRVVPAIAMKILIAIGDAWVDAGFKDNGNLIVTYKMLRIATGISSKNTLALGLRQLEALGLIVVNRGKWSITQQQRHPNRYGLPWISGPNGGPPLKGYLEVQSVEHGKQLLEGLKEKRKDPQARKLRVVIEFEGV